MKQVIDSSGRKIKGLYKKEDGSMVSIDPDRLRKITATNRYMVEQDQLIRDLQSQVSTILKLLEKK